jgi:hypothetical protein
MTAPKLVSVFCLVAFAFIGMASAHDFSVDECYADWNGCRANVQACMDGTVWCDTNEPLNYGVITKIMTNKATALAAEVDACFADKSENGCLAGILACAEDSSFCTTSDEVFTGVLRKIPAANCIGDDSQYGCLARAIACAQTNEYNLCYAVSDQFIGTIGYVNAKLTATIAERDATIASLTEQYNTASSQLEICNTNFEWCATH